MIEARTTGDGPASDERSASDAGWRWRGAGAAGAGGWRCRLRAARRRARPTARALVGEARRGGADRRACPRGRRRPRHARRACPGRPIVRDRPRPWRPRPGRDRRVGRGRREKELTLALARELARPAGEARPGAGRADPRRRPLSDARPARGDRPAPRRQPVPVAPHGQRAQSAGARGDASIPCPTSPRTPRRRASRAAENARRRRAQQRARRFGALDPVRPRAARPDERFGRLARRGWCARRRAASRCAREPHRFAAFHVLRRAEVPAVLFEAGYISNVDDEALLTLARGPRADRRCAGRRRSRPISPRAAIALNAALSPRCRSR